MDRSALIRVGVCALGVVASSVALAQPAGVAWPSVVLKYASNGTPLLHPRVPAASTAAGGGAATLNATQRLAIGNAMANLQLTRNVPLANVAKVARVGARFLGPLAVVGFVYEGVQWLDGQWMTESVAGDVPVGEDYPSNYPINCNVSPAGSAAAFRVDGGANIEVQVVAPTGSMPAGWTMVEACDWKNPPVRRYKLTFPAEPSCVMLSSADSYQCAGPAEPSVATDQELEISFQQGLIASPSLAGQVLDAALASSAARAELLTDALGIAGPATVDGGTRTSTKVDTAGTTTTEIQTTYNLTYSGDTVTVTQTDVQTTTFPDTSQSTTTTTTEAPSGEPPPPEEQSKFCDDFPDASACQELGEHEPDGELGEEQRVLSWSPELSAAGSCPAPITLSIMGSAQSLEWSSVCDLAAGVRPVVIALAWLSAAVFVFGVGRFTAS